MVVAIGDPEMATSVTATAARRADQSGRRGGIPLAWVGGRATDPIVTISRARRVVQRSVPLTVLPSRQFQAEVAPRRREANLSRFSSDSNS